MKRLLAILAACGLSLSLSAGPGDVTFNKETLKYHCPRCRHAVSCKKCIEIPRAEAVKRGGVPCKVCGGTCS